MTVNSTSRSAVALTRRELAGVALGGGAALAAAHLLATPATAQVRDGLAAIARSRGILFGSMTSEKSLDDSAFRQLLRAQCDITGPINAFKWHVMSRASPRQDFSVVDRFVSIARKSGFLVRGHTLLWDKPQMLPKWVMAGSLRDPAEWEQALRARIDQVCGRFAGQIAIWDVVNEALKFNGRPVNGPFAQALGERIFDIAFDAAHSNDPRATLIYNDYVMPEYPRMQDGILALLTGLRERGVPCQGLGIQGHVSRLASDSQYRQWRQFLAAVADLGLRIMITELDVTDTDLPAEASIRDVEGADLLGRFLEETLAERAVSAVMTWGLADRYEGLSYYRPRADGTKRRPTPFDTSLAPKPAYDALRQALADAPSR